jgi:hypothetical protein
LAVVVNAFAASGLLPSEYFLFFEIVNLALIIGLVFGMPRWGIIYSIGWVFAAFILFNSGLLTWIDILVYIIAPIVVLGLRGWMYYQENYG